MLNFIVLALCEISTQRPNMARMLFGTQDHAQPPKEQSIVKRSVIKGADPAMQARPPGINKPTNQRMVDESSIEYTDGHMH